VNEDMGKLLHAEIALSRSRLPAAGSRRGNTRPAGIVPFPRNDFGR
jgi:hypothetical protein